MVISHPAGEKSRSHPLCPPGICPRRTLLRNLTSKFLHLTEHGLDPDGGLKSLLPPGQQLQTHCTVLPHVSTEGQWFSPLLYGQHSSKSPTPASGSVLCIRGEEKLSIGSQRLISTLQQWNLGCSTPLTFGLPSCKMGVRTHARLP